MFLTTFSLVLHSVRRLDESNFFLPFFRTKKKSHFENFLNLFKKFRFFE